MALPRARPQAALPQCLSASPGARHPRPLRSGQGRPGQGTGNALCDDWDTPLRAPAALVLHLDGYDGSMNLLLDLAGRQRVDLDRLSILSLIEQFLAELDGRLRQIAIERRADWVVTASRDQGGPTRSQAGAALCA